MNFLQQIFVSLHEARDRPVVREGKFVTSAGELQRLVAGARAFARKAGLAKGDRAVLLGDNGRNWVALDLALMSEGVIVVPLYSRQAPHELAHMIGDCDPKVVYCGDEALLKVVEKAAPGRTTYLFEEAVADADPAEPVAMDAADPIRIVYTSGTSGDAKGAIFSVGNVDFMLPQTAGRVDELMAGHSGEERVFHYLPCCFAGSWILLLTCLVRGSFLTLCTDLKKLGDELRASDPHFVLNVPLLLERMRSGIEEVVKKRGGAAAWIWRRPWLARFLLYPAVRRQIAPHLRALICGSAPLAEETQRFFMMLGLPVLQVYGLTETTAICTMDRPRRAVPGRVGPAIEGCTMTLDENGEVCVAGPNVFPGYWGKEPHIGPLPTGDLGDVDASGNWRILGRKKHLLVLQSGHNVAPEPLEERLRHSVPGAEQVVVFGDGRPFLVAIVAGTAQRAHVERAVDALNEALPHYQRVRAFHLHGEPFTPDDGLLTANGKLKRAVIRDRFRDRLEELYA